MNQNIYFFKVSASFIPLDTKSLCWKMSMQKAKKVQKKEKTCNCADIQNMEGTFKGCMRRSGGEEGLLVIVEGLDGYCKGEGHPGGREGARL